MYKNEHYKNLIKSMNFLGNDDLYILQEEEEEESQTSSSMDLSSIQSQRGLSRKLSSESDFDGASSGYGSVRRGRTISELSDHAVSFKTFWFSTLIFCNIFITTQDIFLRKI